MPNKKKEDLYNKPFADEANKGWKHLVEYCFDLYEEAEKSQYRAKKLQEIQSAVEEYHQDEKTTTDPWPGAASYTLPLTTITCDNLEPRMVAGLVGKTPVVRFEPENNQPQEEQTEILQEWFNQELENVVGVEEMARSTVHRILQEGTVYLLPYYDIDEEVRADFVFENNMDVMVNDEPEFAAYVAALIESNAAVFQNGILMNINEAKPVTRDYHESLFEGGKYILVPFHDVYIPDDADDWEKTPVIRKVRPTYAELMRDSEKKDGYMNIGPWLCDESGNTKFDDNQISASQRYDSIKVHGKKTIECIECSVTYMYRDDEEEEKDSKNFHEERLIAQIAVDSRVLVRLIPLRSVYHKNQHMLKRMRLFPEKGKSYGTGMAAKMKSIAKGASKTFNTAINIVELVMIPYYFFTEASGMKRRYPDGIKLKLGMGYPLDDVSQIYFPKFSINPDQMFNWINLWVSFWERLASIGDLQIGRQGNKERTATETMAVIQEGNVKHNYQATSMKVDFLSVIKTFYDLYYQHMPFNKTFLWMGQDVQIPRWDMRRVKKFTLTGSTELSNKLIKRKENEDLYNLTAQNPNINPIKMSEELVKAYGHQDTSEWVNPAIKGIVDKIMQNPKMGQMVQQFMAETQQQMEMDAKAAEMTGAAA